MCSPQTPPNGGNASPTSAISISPKSALEAPGTPAHTTTTWSIGQAVPLSSVAPPAGPKLITSSPPGAPIPSYPPTEVKRWLTCPVFRDYSKRWEPRASRWTPHAPVGTGIHAAIAVLLRHLQTGSSISRPALNAEAEAAGLVALGEKYEAQETWAIEGLQKLVVKGYRVLRDCIETELLPGATILGVELVDPHNPVPPGVKVPRIVDCVLAREDGTLEVWDWKSKMRLDDQYLGETMRATLHQWQLLDYAWHVQEWFQRPVSRAGWGLIVLAPSTKARLLPVKLEPGRLDQWRRDADQIWFQMSGDDHNAQARWHNWEACSDRHLHFGRECIYIPACHELLGDESLFSGLYKQRVYDEPDE